MIQYPEILQIETAGSCNAHCSFCPHSTMNRKGSDKMTEAKFKQLIDEAAQWPITPHCVLPFLTNEPFADNRIYEFCRYVNLNLPNTKLAFFTNGSLFTAGTLGKLNAVKNVDFIHVSLHHGNKADYESDLGLNFESTIESIKRLVKFNGWTVRIARVQDGDSRKDKEFLALCAREFPHINTMLCARFNWKGDIREHEFPIESTLDRFCSRHNTMTVLFDGRIALCCMDQSGKYTLGDTSKMSLLEIYNAPLAVQYRSRTKRESEPCRICNMI